IEPGVAAWAGGTDWTGAAADAERAPAACRAACAAVADPDATASRQVSTAARRGVMAAMLTARAHRFAGFLLWLRSPRAFGDLLKRRWAPTVRGRDRAR